MNQTNCLNLIGLSLSHCDTRARGDLQKSGLELDVAARIANMAASNDSTIPDESSRSS